MCVDPRGAQLTQPTSRSTCTLPSPLRGQSMIRANRVHKRDPTLLGRMRLLPCDSTSSASPFTRAQQVLRIAKAGRYAAKLIAHKTWEAEWCPHLPFGSLQPAHGLVPPFCQGSFSSRAADPFWPFFIMNGSGTLHTFGAIEMMKSNTSVRLSRLPQHFESEQLSKKRLEFTSSTGL